MKTPKSTRLRRPGGWLLAVVLLMTPTVLRAGHLVWLDLSQFNLSAYPRVDHVSPPGPLQETVVKQLVRAHLQADLAPYDIQVTLHEPAGRRHTWLQIRPEHYYMAYGCSEEWCCLNNHCSGVDSWRQQQSGCVVYAGSFRELPEFSSMKGKDLATSPRIANAIAHIAAHELGHVLSLDHCYADDSIRGRGITSCKNSHNYKRDQQKRWHIMLDWNGGQEPEDMAEKDLFFTVHSSRRTLQEKVDFRNISLPLLQTAGTDGADLCVAHVHVSDGGMTWSLSQTLQNHFESPATWHTGFGQPGDLFLLADVKDDGLADVLRGESVDADTMRWSFAVGHPGEFRTLTNVSVEIGRPGDRFFLAHYDASQDDWLDFVVAHPDAAGGLVWTVHPATDKGEWGPGITLNGSVGSADAVVRPGQITQPDSSMDLVVYDGSDNVLRIYGLADQPSPLQVPNPPPGPPGFQLVQTLSWTGPSWDHVLVGNVDGQGPDDLLLGRVVADDEVEWELYLGLGCGSAGLCYPSQPDQTRSEGRAGDLFRLADADGDGDLDLFRWTPEGVASRSDPPVFTEMKWRVVPSGLGGLQNALSPSEIGEEGSLYP